MKSNTIPSYKEAYQRILSIIPTIYQPITAGIEKDYLHLQQFEDYTKEVFQEYIKYLDECTHYATRNEVGVAFAGYFSSGKTSLINKLLGDSIFRVTAGEESGVSCYISKGGANRFFLNYFTENNEDFRTQEVSYEDFKAKTSMSELGDGRFDSIATATVELNNPNIPDNITWIDTAGLTTQNNEMKRARLSHSIGNADVIVWICKSGGSGGFLTQDEQTLLLGLSNHSFNTPIFLINNINIEVNDWKDWIENTEDEIKESIQKDDKYFVSNTFIQKAWQQLYTEDYLANKVEIVKDVFRDHTPIVPSIEELEKLYAEPNSERTKSILEFIHSKKPVHVQLHSFSTYKKCSFIENELSFEHFRKQLNQLNHKEHPLIYHSRIAKIKFVAKQLFEELSEHHSIWVAKVVTNEDSLLAIEKTVQSDINEIITTYFDKAISELENHKKEAIAKFEKEHENLKREYLNKYNSLNNASISATSWNSFVDDINVRYLYYDGDNRGDYDYQIPDEHAKYTYTSEGQSQSITQSIIGKDNKGKGFDMTLQLLTHCDNVMGDLFKELWVKIYTNLYESYYLHLLENTDWFNEQFKDSILQYIKKETYKSLLPPFKIICLGFVLTKTDFLSNYDPFSKMPTKLTSIVNVEESIKKTKANITEAYDNYINYLKNLKKCKIEEDKTAFLKLFKDEYLREYYDIQKLLKDSIDKCSDLLEELQLHSVLRP